jgi:hypothetical protein
LGLIAHKKETFQGQHDAIVDRSNWDAVQEKLTASRRCQGRPRRNTAASPLMGRLYDEAGRRLTPTHAVKGSRYYRYYESHSDAVAEGRLNQNGFVPWRLPAQEVEKRVFDIVRSMLADRAAIARAATDAGGAAADVQAVLDCAGAMDPASTLECVQRVQLFSDHLVVAISIPGKLPSPMTSTVPMELKRRGCERRVVIGSQAVAKVDGHAIKGISLGLRFWEQLNLNAPVTAVDFAQAEGVDNRYIGRTLPLAFLAPDIVEMFASGRQPADWTAERLIRWDPLPPSWDEQRRVIGLR